ncbi:hypothetical protein T265_12462 [Opisthorchis viverrini]|uniref:Uncharacterized protein n=1 Tax=Opisthorchis viverrini TaxID=6198 RepID=A0A075A7F4_OPIVI|nr:hypothetical protein T265_12462 [Opisthorchis viverrini]KER34312.1 hypothetical protein T265_12462 [Opisthorchis viverrini]
MGEKLRYGTEGFHNEFSEFCVANTSICNNKFSPKLVFGRRSDSEKKLSVQTMANPSVLPRMIGTGHPKIMHLGFKESNRKKPRKLPATSTGTVKKHALEKSTSFYETNRLSEEPLYLSVQSQRDLVQNLCSNSIPKLKTYEIDKDCVSLNSEKLVYRVIHPVNIQLLTARVGRVTMDLADYISKETVGKQPTHRQSNVLPKAPKCPLDALTDIYLKAIAAQEIPYPKCQSLPKIQSDRPPVTSLGASYRTPRRYHTKAGKLFTVHPHCARRRPVSTILDLEIALSSAKKKAPTAKQTRRRNKSSLSLSSRSTVPIYSNPLRKSDKKVAKTRKPKLFPQEVSQHRSDSPEAPSSFMLEEAETTSEDDVMADDDFLTVSQADKESQWEATSIGTLSPRKTQSDSKFLEGKRSSTIVIPRRSVYFKMRQMFRSQQLNELCRLSIVSNDPDGLNILRRLLQLLIVECNPRATYYRYRQDRQILFGLSLAELSKNYSPQAVKEIQRRLVRICHRSEVVLNDQESMYYLQQRLEEIHKNKILQMESALEQQEFERFRFLLSQNTQNRDVLEAELLRRGKCIYHQLCNNPVILMPKVQRGKKSLPVFSVNPTWNRYKDCYMKEDVLLPKREVLEGQDLSPEQYTKSQTAKLAWKDKLDFRHSSMSKVHTKLLPRDSWTSDIPSGGEEVRYSQQPQRTRYFLPKRSVIHEQMRPSLNYFTDTDEETTENILQVYQAAQHLLKAARLENIYVLSVHTSGTSEGKGLEGLKG